MNKIILSILVIIGLIGCKPEVVKEEVIKEVVKEVVINVCPPNACDKVIEATNQECSETVELTEAAAQEKEERLQNELNRYKALVKDAEQTIKNLLNEKIKIVSTLNKCMSIASSCEKALNTCDTYYRECIDSFEKSND